jgi:hypothetical protein
MKPSPFRVAIVYLVFIAAMCVVIALKLTIWSSPGIVTSPDGPSLVVDSLFLGRYALGLERIRIASSPGGETIVELRDPGGALPNVFRLRAGENTIVVPGRESVRFILAPGRAYALTLCGDNGWGRTGCRTKGLQLP